MKKLYVLMALLSGAALGFSAQGTSQTSHESVQVVKDKELGQKKMMSLRQSYDSHQYDPFLASLESDYQAFVKTGSFGEFVKMRTTPPLSEKEKPIAAHFEILHQKLVNDLNNALQTAVKESTDEVLIQRVQSATLQLPKEQVEALQYITSLQFKTPDQAVNADEQKLIAIDLSTEFKTMHSDALNNQQPANDRFEKQMVINMEMIHQMQIAAQSFQDTSLKEKVDLAATAYDTWHAHLWDLNLLKQVVKKPHNDVERKLASALDQYKTEKENLYQKEFLSKIE